MRETRSASQILFNLLPEQTLDMSGRIWKVDEWRDPNPLDVDDKSVRRHLLRSLDPWVTAGRDRDMARQLWEKHSLEIVELNKHRGVAVEQWPRVWMCKRCRRIRNDSTRACHCGSTSWGQFHFVGYHSCGAVFEPRVPRCPAHDDVGVNSPGTAQAKDFEFACPSCHRVLMKGLGVGRKCDGCGQAPVSYTVHRAASVYTSHGFTMVNAPTTAQLSDLQGAGGPARCLDWVLDGLPGQRPGAEGQSRAGFVAELVAKGLAPVVAEAAAAAAEAAGQEFSGGATHDLGVSEHVRSLAEEEAQDLALAVHHGRIGSVDLADREVGPDLGEAYRERYPSALNRSRLRAVELVDRFPVLRGVFGYTRSSGKNAEPDLVSFRGRRGAYRVYAEANETEALLLRFDPVAVVAWLRARGHPLPDARDDLAARKAVIRHCTVPRRGEELPVATPGSDLLTLLHSYTHRFIRGAAVLAGIDRDALAEYLLPLHLSGFVYAGSRGDFVLGGLQALFETDLDKLLDEVSEGESRCPLDPGCARAGGACLACLHLGEPSCNYFNRFLDRKSLTGRTGYLTAPRA